MKYFEAKRPAGDGVCSDNACPCPQVRIPRGTGYLYIPQELVDFRRDARTDEEADRKANRLAEEDPLAKMAKQYGASSYARILPPGKTNPILMCEQGARLRRIDLVIASADAKHWWKTGLVPLRVTPLVTPKKGVFGNLFSKKSPKPSQASNDSKETLTTRIAKRILIANSGRVLREIDVKTIVAHAWNGQIDKDAKISYYVLPDKFWVNFKPAKTSEEFAYGWCMLQQKLQHQDGEPPYWETHKTHAYSGFIVESNQAFYVEVYYE